MGSSSSNSNLSYSAVHQSSQTPNESAIYRHPDFLNSLLKTPDPSITTIKDLLLNSCNKYGSKFCLGKQKFGTYYWRTYQESIDLSKAFGSGLYELGIYPPLSDYKEFEVNFMGIYSKNREEVLFADFACVFYGWTSVPIYDTLGSEALDFIFDQTGVELLACSSENLKKLIKEKRFGKLKTIVSFEKVLDSSEIQILFDFNIKLYFFDDVVISGRDHIRPIVNNQSPSSLFTFSYTSGTTGKPKGAMLTHGNLISVVAVAAHSLDLNDNDVYLSYLPLAHILEKIVMITLLYFGASIGFYSGDVQKLKEDLSILRPTFFVTVPRLLLRFHDAIKTGIGKLKGCKRSLALKAIATKLSLLKTKGTVKHGFYDKIIFKKMNSALGGRVRWILVGSAPTSPEVLNFLKVVFCCNIIEGYGQTESTGASFLTHLLDNRLAGTVGGPVPSTEYKLMDVPEMNYRSTDIDSEGKSLPRGEMCVRGPGVFKGYYKDEEKTKEALDEKGWLHTGDIVQINMNGTVKIIDRKKNIFKLSHGEYVAAEKIESVYLQDKCITEIFVYGDSLQSYLIAIVVVNMDAIKEFANKNFINDENEEILIKKKEIKNFVMAEMNKTAKQAKLLGFEMVKNISLEKEGFAMKEILTTTFKLKRHEAKKYYENVIENLYKEIIDN